MGRGQAVRQRVLVPLLGGSNPSVPDRFYQNKNCALFFNNLLFKSVMLDTMWSNLSFWFLMIQRRIIFYLSILFLTNRIECQWRADGNKYLFDIGRMGTKIKVQFKKKRLGGHSAYPRLPPLIFILKLVSHLEKLYAPYLSNLDSHMMHSESTCGRKVK